MNNCPKIFIKVNKKLGIISPVSGIIPKLDTAFKKDAVRECNRQKYGKYTQDFINTCDETDVYYSTSYSYDPKNFAFDFYDIKVCSENDYIEMEKEESLALAAAFQIRFRQSVILRANPRHIRFLNGVRRVLREERREQLRELALKPVLAGKEHRVHVLHNAQAALQVVPVVWNAAKRHVVLHQLVSGGLKPHGRGKFLALRQAERTQRNPDRHPVVKPAPSVYDLVEHP